MSSDGNVNGRSAVNITSKPFFCHQCNRTVDVPISSSSDPFCPVCNDGFLEEYENPDPNPGSDSFFSLSDPFSSFLPLLSAMNSSPSPASVDLHGTNLRRSTRGDPFVFDPFTLIQQHLGDLRSSGANIEFVIQNNRSEAGFRVPANLGDYFMGPGLEQLIQQLAENDPNRYGTPPASKSAIDSLPSVEITKDHLSSKSNQCAVCMDDFEEGIQVKQMPCKHLYHNDCILPWLELHNSCPVCRHELPTDDPDYERRVRGQRSAGDNRTVERSFRISLPGSFQARPSGSGSADNADTIQEDLD
ncbi:BCA2 zinc finger ATL 8 [Hibiscus trionum]|uniref:RING-type E3 ubiquitin transferase n=1 Tax=Hibiscus trionum TaxID=183268 RepID=A0A9W7JH38_HIBTR|nr:BCA2 zinc finger ATL 8 [Hibiscus trionum]